MPQPPGTGATRAAAFAGRWYPADPEVLAADVDRWLAAASAPAMHVVGLVAPHAGVTYSGHVAALGYACLRDSRARAVVLVGPSHYAPFHGCALVRSGAFATPFGPLPVDEDLAGRLAGASPLLAQERRDVHAREHSLELHLPFLARVLPEVPIVPILMGHQTTSTMEALGDVLGDVLAGAGVVLAASSDLSHYESAEVAARLDGQVVDRLDALDPEGLARLLDARPGHACGGGPMVAVMRAARRLGATTGRVLRYADSGDVSGDKAQVVGYVSAVFGSAENGS